MSTKHYLLYGSERYGGAEIQPGETLLPSTEAVRDFAPITVLTSSNAVPHFFPGVKTEVFHGFDAGKPRHI